MLSRGKAKRVANPDFIGQEFVCPTCGGRFKVTKRTAVSVLVAADRSTRVGTQCPYCNDTVDLSCDPHKQFRDKLTTFILSQVEPIKAIADDKVRLPMEHLLDDFNRLVQEED